MAFGQFVGVVITWWQVIGMIWWESRPDDVREWWRRFDSAAAKLKAMISVTATVLRDGQSQETRVSQLVPGDVVVLAAGDMIPADVRLLTAKDLFVTQSSLTGESFPVEKFAVEKNPSATLPIELTSIALLGTSVESGSATGIVVASGKDTYLGGVSASLSEQEPPTSFDRGISQFTWLLVRFVLVMVPMVFLINGLTKGNWGEAYLAEQSPRNRGHP